jgi:hypothetical protein
MKGRAEWTGQTADDQARIEIVYERMLLAQKRSDCHERPRPSLFPCSRDALSLLSDGKVEVDQERRPRRVVIILIDHEIVD